MVDTGASITLLRYDQYELIAQCPPLTQKSIRASTMGDGSLEVMGVVETTWVCGKAEATVMAVVIKDMPYKAVLGLTAIKALQATPDVVRGILRLEGHNAVPMHGQAGG